MTPEQLKVSILQYAIQGKLVEQRPEEGTAEELLSLIKSKKEQLIKEKVLKKTKPLETIIEEELPFDLPQSWKWVKWGDIVNIVSARRVHQSDWQKEGIPFYRAREIAEMSRNNGQVDNDLFISEELYNEFSTSGVPKPGDIMVTAVGTLGKTYIVKDGDKFYYKDASVICFENHFQLCSEYLAMMMDTPLMKQQIKSNSDGTTVATLTMVRMNEYLFPLPPLAEQHRIVAKIEEMLPFVDRYAASYEKLEQFNAKFPEDMRKSILQYAIQGKLVEQRPEEGTAEELYKAIQEEKKQYKIKTIETNPIEEPPFDIPDSWKWIQLQDIVKKTIKRGKSPKYTENSNIQVFAQKCNVKTGGINMELAQYLDLNTAEKYPDEEYMVNGDIIINSTGGGTMGRVGIFHDTDRLNNMKIVPDGHVTIIRACDMVDYKYLYYFIKHNQKYLETQGEGSTNQTELKPVTIASLALPLPPLEEQKRIVAKIEELLPYCDQLLK